MTRRLTILAIIGALVLAPVFAMAQDPIKKPDVSKLRKQSTSSTTTSSSSPSKKSSATTVSSATGSISGHGYVDLGLSVKWATMNVGASSPEGYGDYYAWGETSSKSSYDEDNSKTYGKSSYNHDIGGDSSTDAACANWGGSWRLPTAEEFQELVDNCNWTWTTLNGKAGYKVVSKKNGNSIFLPATGCRGGTSLNFAGSYGGYWSSSPGSSDTGSAYYLDFSSSIHNVYYYFYRYYGLTVRPVSTTTSSSSPSKKSSTTVSSATGSISGHGYVDLGLSVKWATMNVGASSPEGYGDYYAWGETSPKSSYDSDNSKTYGKSSYNHDIGGDSSTDAACANWGGSWRLPTAEEFQELLDNCEWTWTTLKGKEGYKVVSKKNGNSIFLPAAGGRDGTSLLSAGSFGFYWSSTSGSGYANDACYLGFDGSSHCVNFNFYRNFGLTVRPVSTTTSSSSPSKKSSATTVSSATGSISGHGYVDLGLSVKWATMNVGASSPEGYGDYYAWGEKSPKSSYDADNSKTYGRRSYNHDIGGTSRDVAHVSWGGSWRLPTAEELQELKDNCEWTWTTLNGKAGYKVVSKKNGNSIFLPAAGYRDGTSLNNAGSYGYYWSSAPLSSNTYDAYSLYFNSGRHLVFDYNRYYGRSVRPVSE